jgi:hypothetical protein
VNKYTRLGVSTLTMILLHLVVAGALFGIWNLTIDNHFVADRLLNPLLLDNNADTNIIYANEIVSFIYLAFLYLILWSIVLSFTWLVFSSISPIERPGQAKKLTWLWVILLIAGLGGAFLIFGTHFLELGDYTDQTDLLAEDKRIPMASAWGGMFFVFYFLCGTFFTTPKIVRTAVPFAAHVFRS